MMEETVPPHQKSMMQNFLSYIRLEGEQTFNILEELKELKFKKKKEHYCPMLFDVQVYIIILYKHTDY